MGTAVPGSSPSVTSKAVGVPSVIGHQEHDGATLLSVSGVVTKSVEELREQLPPKPTTTGPVIVDLEAATLLHRAGFKQFLVELEAFSGERRLCLVCRRPSALRLLRSWGVDRLVPVFLTVDGALGHSAGVDEPDSHGHIVEFYEGDEFLVDSVREFLAPALRADDAVIVVAAEEHRNLFEPVLGNAGLDLETARATGRYTALDAEEALASFMVDGVPEAARFKATIGGLVTKAAGAGRRVRVYGEMVAVLWAAGNVSAAMALEDLWNELGRVRQFELMCAYPLAGFDRADATWAFHKICSQHSTVVPTERYSSLDDPEQRARAVASMQQEAAAALTERARLEARVQELEQLATADPLTGLPNRRFLLEQLDQALALANREGWDVAVLFLDLDRFKDVNHRWGHHFGDLLLVEVSRRLRGALRESDTVARLGGDEFAVVLSGPTSAQEAAAAAQRVLESVRTGFEADGVELSGSCSVGVARWSAGCGSGAELLHNADMAMYRAKDAGGDRYEVSEATLVP